MACPQAWEYRYLLVCRWGFSNPVRVSAWHRPGEAGGWVRLCEPIPLVCFQERFLAPAVAGKTRGGPPKGLRR